MLPIYAVLSTIIHHQLQLHGLMPPTNPLEAFGIAWYMAGLLYMLADCLADAWIMIPRMLQLQRAQRAARRQEVASC
jgi:hypothetical protein